MARWAVTAWLLWALCSLASVPVVAQPETAPDTLGIGSVAVGDVTPTSAIIWVLETGDNRFDVELSRTATFDDVEAFAAATSSSNAEAGQVEVGGLRPATTYHYRFRYGKKYGYPSETVRPGGRFRTAPADETAASVSFLHGGDLGGQGYCRDAEHGYRIFAAMTALEPDFFIADGDLIYADATCPSRAPDGRPNVPGEFANVARIDWSDGALLSHHYRGHWRYNLADRHVREFRRTVPWFAQWDDHEVLNDFGLNWPEHPRMPDREDYPALARSGYLAFRNHNPIRQHPSGDRMYRSFRWGRHLEVFLLDGRSYRDRNDAVDRPRAPKTLLGVAQREWLTKGLVASTATWKIVSSNVPLSVPTGSDPHLYGRDGFADGTEPDFSSRTGFEHELLEILREIDVADVTDVIFLTTDIHLAMSLRYELDFDGDGDPLLFHELISGPLQAFRALEIPKLDPTLAPTVLFAEAGRTNFARVEVDGRSGGLRAEIRDQDGKVRFGSVVELAPEKAKR